MVCSGFATQRSRSRQSTRGPGCGKPKCTAHTHTLLSAALSQKLLQDPSLPRCNFTFPSAGRLPRLFFPLLHCFPSRGVPFYFALFLPFLNHWCSHPFTPPNESKQPCNWSFTRGINNSMLAGTAQYLHSPASARKTITCQTCPC